MTSEIEDSSRRQRDHQRPLICIATSIHPDYDGRIYRHARAMALLGYQVDLVCPWKLPSAPLPEGLRLVPFERVASRWLRPVGIAYRMLPLLLARPYELYHFHDLDALPLFAAVRMMRRRPVVYDCHENYSDEMRYRAYHIPHWTRGPLASAVKWGERIAAATLDEVVIVVTNQQTTFPAPFFRTTLVRNYAEQSLERNRLDNYSTRESACISIASQYIDNGALFVLDVAREVALRGPGMRFLIADRYGTDRQLRERVLNKRSELGLEKVVEFLPNVAAPEIMRNLNLGTIGLAMDAAVPHRIKALPIKLFEYMAAGIPIVASDLPNSREVVTAAGCGILVEPRSAVAFADAICKLAADRTAAEEMGRSGLQAFRTTFNWDREVAKLDEVYRRLLHSRHTSP